MRKTTFVFGALAIALLSLFQLSKYSVVSGGIAIELIIAVIAIISFLVGIYFTKKNATNSNTSPQIDNQKIKELEISTREHEVLVLIAEGLSNKEIANRLFLSESTIKTHVSNLLSKLNAKRRTQAIQIAKELHIL